MKTLAAVFASSIVCFPCILSLALVFPAAADTWSGTLADQMIGFDDNEYARAVQVLASSSTGTVHVVWSEDAPSIREIHHGRSTDQGLTWSSSASDRIISHPDGNGVNPEECDIAEDRIHESLIVVWSEILAATREVHYGISTDDGVSWSCETQDQVLSDPTTAADTGAPTVITDWSGVIHAVWSQMSPAGTNEVHYSRSTDGGVSWSGSTADRVISFPDGNGAASPQISADNVDRLVVAWRETGAAGQPVIHAGVSSNGGITWSSETSDHEASQPASIITDLAISSDPFFFSVGFHVVYRASFNVQAPYYYEIYATSSGDGLYWDGSTRLIPVSYDEGGGRSASNPDIFVSAAQGIIAVWDEESETTGTQEQHLSRCCGAGGDWTGATADEIISFPDGEDGYRPSIHGYWGIIAGPNGILDIPDDTFVAWTEFAGGATDNYEVHLSSNQLITSEAEETAQQEETFRALPNPSFGPILLTWTLPSSGATGVEIVDPAGRCVRTLALPVPAGMGQASWDRFDDSGHRVPAGCYIARLTTTAGKVRSVLCVLL